MWFALRGRTTHDSSVLAVAISAVAALALLFSGSGTIKLKDVLFQRGHGWLFGKVILGRTRTLCAIAYQPGIHGSFAWQNLCLRRRAGGKASVLRAH